MDRLGLMNVSITREGGNEVPIKPMLHSFKHHDFFFPPAGLSTRNSVAYAFNAVMFAFRGLSAQSILRDQYTVDVTPSDELLDQTDYAEGDEDRGDNLSYHLGIFNDAPHLVGGGDVFAPIPLGKEKWATSNLTNKMDRIVFSALLERCFNPVPPRTLLDPVSDAYQMTNKTNSEVGDFIVFWANKEALKDSSPWLVDARSEFISVKDGTLLPWNR